MQVLLNNSKNLILAILSCLLLVAWNSDNADFASLGYIDAKQSASSKHVDSIWHSLSKELRLDHNTQSSRVQAEIHKLLADQEKLYEILKAAGPYIYFIHQQTQARGLPAEIALIPVIESEFNPNDHSKRGATGLWQLMPGTAHELGIKIRSSYDGRRNVVASTTAALSYFRDLGHYFKGNWYLAIAAYNCGQFRVDSAQRHAGSHSFWNLSLPRETKYYVPKLLAVAAIIKNPEKYGVELPPINDEPYFTELKSKKFINMAKIAKSSGTSVEIMQSLNPDYAHGAIAIKGFYSLLVPVKKLASVKSQIADAITDLA